MPKPISSPPQSELQPGSEHVLPLHTPGTASLLLAACIATIAWLSLAAQTDITVHRMLARGLSVFDGIERLSSYLTNLTVFAVALSFSCVAALGRSPVGRFFCKPPVVTAVVVYIVFVGLAYNLLLRHLWTPSGYRAVLNECLHTVLPVLSVIYWVLFVPRFHLSLRQCLLWLAYPLGYLCITLWRGSTSDFYPYPFIDVGELGYPHVLLNATLLVLAFITLMGLFITLNHRRPH
ncbi:Pr6Pr family membrane protein [Caballeronia sp. SEWSISQ10-4 2]|uniref:Pr6Pr family membrane protein n=1 Tax=Caballeronia sp. SEWSISQ10-4 2 TaxID=2937438 RepID=UPI00265635F2|nr:Pr6Pr family membrane protein [Caballeronia sp. SEWSISQ10-4 2]MDN7181433.1 Pr6Pr family membrane protein [Caballeronia sp. SEWSISQ10-4 2]